MTAYALRSDLTTMGLPSAALTGVSTADQDSALEAASRLLDSYLSPKWGVPVPSPNAALKMHTCAVASYLILSVRGYSPEGVNSTLRQRHDDAIAWATKCGKGEAFPCDQGADATPGDDEAGVLVSTDETGFGAWG
jgi:phage gp36-like protein